MFRVRAPADVAIVLTDHDRAIIAALSRLGAALAPAAARRAADGGGAEPEPAARSAREGRVG